jgi:hypothetical protein
MGVLSTIEGNQANLQSPHPYPIPNFANIPPFQLGRWERSVAAFGGMVNVYWTNFLKFIYRW